MTPAEDLVSRYRVIAINTKDKVLAAQLWEKIKFIKLQENKNAGRKP